MLQYTCIQSWQCTFYCIHSIERDKNYISVIYCYKIQNDQNATRSNAVTHNMATRTLISDDSIARGLIIGSRTLISDDSIARGLVGSNSFNETNYIRDESSFLGYVQEEDDDYEDEEETEIISELFLESDEYFVSTIPLTNRQIQSSAQKNIDEAQRTIIQAKRKVNLYRWASFSSRLENKRLEAIRLHIRESTKNNTNNQNNQNNAAINYKTTTRIPKPTTRSLLQVTIPELSDEDTLSSSPNFFAANMYDTNDDDEDNVSDEDEFNLFQPNESFLASLPDITEEERRIIKESQKRIDLETTETF